MNGRNERGYAHAPTSDGGHIIVGTKYSMKDGSTAFSPGYGIEVIKTWPDGTIKWRRHYRMAQVAPDIDEAAAFAVKERIGGIGQVLGYVVTGYVYDKQSMTEKDIFLMRIDLIGEFPTPNPVFSMFDGGQGMDDVGYDIIQTNAGGGPGFLIVGGANGTPGSVRSQYESGPTAFAHQGQLCMIKTNTNGVLQWSRLIYEPLPFSPPPGTFVHEYARGYSVVETDDAFVAVGVHDDPFVGFQTPNSRLYMVKVDKNTQAVLWTKTYPDPSGSFDIGYSVIWNRNNQQNPGDDEYVVLGSSYRTSSDANGSFVTEDVYMITTDNNGLPKAGKCKIYYGRGEEAGRDIAHADDNGDGTDDSYICTGYTTTFSGSHKDIFVQQMTPSGGILTSGVTRKLEGDGDDIGYSVAQDNAQYYSVAGISENGPDDIYLARIERTQRCQETCEHLSLSGVMPAVLDHPFTSLEVEPVTHHMLDIDPPLPLVTLCSDCSIPDPQFCSDPAAYRFQHQNSLYSAYIDYGMTGIQVREPLSRDYVHAGYFRWTGSFQPQPSIGTTHKTSITLVKTSHIDGTNIWKRIYPIENEDYLGHWQSHSANDLIEAFDRALVMGGSFEIQEGMAGGRIDSNCYIFKVDMNGQLSPGLWFSKSYGLFSFTGNHDDVGRSIRETPDDIGYILAGYSNSPFNASTPSDHNVYVIKTDQNGNCRPAMADEWAYVYGGDYEDRGMSVRVCLNSSGQEDGYIVAGYSNSFSDVSDGVRDFDIYLLRLENDGTIRWTKTYGTAGNELGFDVAITEDDGFVITGLVDNGSGSTVQNDLFILKTDAQGNLEWSRLIDHSSDDQGRSVYVTSDGGYAVAGCTITEDYGKQMYLIKFGECQDVQWSTAFPTADPLADPFVADQQEADWAEDLIQTHDGGFLVTGTSRSYYDISNGMPVTATPVPPISPDAYHIQHHLVKTGCEGEVCLSENPDEQTLCLSFQTMSPSSEQISVVEDQEIIEHDAEALSNPFDQTYRICPEDDRVESTEPSDGTDDPGLGAVSGVEPSTGTLEQGTQLSIQPTPIKAGEILTIRLGKEHSANSRLVATDVVGRLVYSMPLSPGFETWNIDTRGWQPGTYLIAIRDGKTSIATGKVVIVK